MTLDRIRGRLTYANVMATAAMFVALGGGAYALSGVPDASGSFHGCVSKKTGNLRVVSAGSSCRKPRGRGAHRDRGEFAITWNQRGVKGIPGVQGAQGNQGIQGVQGVQGNPGATHVVVRTGTSQEVGASTTLEADCLSGERATGGGATVLGGSGQGRLVDSAPVPNTAGATPTGWTTTANSNSVSSTVTLTPFVVCASP